MPESKSIPRKLTTPEQWEEWFEKCALAKCKPETRTAMSRFAWERYRKFLDQALAKIQKHPDQGRPTDIRDLLAPESNVPGDVGNCWHDLESEYWWHVKPESNEEGKTYKKWYRSKAASVETGNGPEEARNFLEGAVTNNLVRTRCRKIVASLPMWSELEELPPDLSGPPDQEPASESEARDLAETVFGEISEEDRFFLCVVWLGMPVNSEKMLDCFGMKKTQAYRRREKALSNVLRIFKKHDAKDSDAKMAAALGEKLRIWAKSPECPFARCFEGIAGLKDIPGASRNA